MPSVRNLIQLAVLVLVISLAGAWLSLFRPPDSGGMGRDTYGVTGNGYRAVFDVLRELNVPVRRQLGPPKPEHGATLVFLQPDQQIAGTEPTYLHSLLPWVEQGGRLIVTLPSLNVPSHDLGFEGLSPVKMPSILESLGLSGVEIDTLSTVPADARLRKRPRTLDDESITEDLLKVFGGAPAAPKETEAHCQGTLAVPSIVRLALPGDSVQTLKIGNAAARGTISYVSGDQEHVLVAEFGRGTGTIVIVSEHALFHNRLLARGDNSILAVHLFSHDGTAVVFDEFYHGLGVRGNPLYLMTRPGYAALALGLLLFSCVSVWREATLLGPSLPDAAVQRRDIGEYLTAMGRFFSYGATTRPFLIRQIRSGVLWKLSREFAMAPENQDVEMIAGVVSRRDPLAGERLRTTIADIDKELDSRTHWTESQTINAMRRLTACLSTNT